MKNMVSLRAKKITQLTLERIFLALRDDIAYSCVRAPTIIGLRKAQKIKTASDTRPYNESFERTRQTWVPASRDQRARGAAQLRC